ncbi:MAG: hypothetical protein EBS05_11235 [Proteobacteria bacterium]|nr:hypothetical protein [Pseudomonadota bacterium]
MSENLYDQPVKKRVRDQILAHAVKSLTSERKQAPLVTEEAFMRTLDYACRFVKQGTGQDIEQAVKPFVDEYWLPIYLSRVSSRSPTDLQVLILSGPNPLNDIVALSELGVPPHNVWAVEADRDEYLKAVRSLGERRLPIRLYCGSLQEFFAVVPQQFDIIYFDGCGPLLGGKPQTLPVLRELFINQRLAPTSALITNFCAANMEGNASRKWAKRMMTWYAARYEEPHYFSDLVAERAESHRMNNDDDNAYLEHVETHLADYYSDFVSGFIIEFASHLLPWWRVLAAC